MENKRYLHELIEKLNEEQIRRVIQLIKGMLKKR